MALFILEASEMYAIETAVNKVNDCNLSSFRQDRNKPSATIAKKPLFEAYGTEFATSDDSKSTTTSTLFDEISTTKSIWAARAAEAVASYESWENLMGNTIMSFLSGTLRGKRRSEQSILFEVLHFVLFFPLYVLLAVYSILQRLVPCSCPSPVLYKLNHLIITVVEFSYTISIGIVCVIFRVCIGNKPPLEAKSEYITIGEDEPKYIVIDIVKPMQNIKVGIRFGADKNGILTISNLKANSLAYQAGLRIGNQVKSINGTDVLNCVPRDAAKQISESTGVVRLEVLQSENVIEYDENTV